MPVLKNTDSLADGLSGLTDVMQGALYAEEQSYKRDVDERDYNFKVTRHEEGVRQFDESFEENTRQFNENMAYNVEQNSLLRQHQIALQDDAQDHDVFIQDDRQEFQTVENKRDRAVEYHRTNESVRMQNEDRALRASKDKYADNRNFLGTSDSFATMPDEFMVDRNDEVHNPKDVDLQAHMKSIVDGNGSSLFAGMSVSDAQAISNGLDNGEDKMVHMEQLEKEGYFSRIPNTGKEEGLQRLMQKQSGLPLKEFNNLGEQDRANLRGDVIHQLNNTRQYEKHQNKLTVEHAVAKRSADLGTSPYMGSDRTVGAGTGRVKSQEDIVREMDQSFNMPVTYSSDWDFPTPSKDASPAIMKDWRKGADWVVKYRNIAEGPGTDEEKLANMEAHQVRLKEIREDTRDTYEREGYDGSWADTMYDAWSEKAATNTYSREKFYSTKNAKTARNGDGNTPNQDDPFSNSSRRKEEMKRAQAGSQETSKSVGASTREMIAAREHKKTLDTLELEDTMTMLDNAYNNLYGRSMTPGEAERSEKRIRANEGTAHYEGVAGALPGTGSGNTKIYPSGNREQIIPKIAWNAAQSLLISREMALLKEERAEREEGQ